MARKSRPERRPDPSPAPADHAAEIAEQFRLEAAGDPSFDPDRLWDLHFLVNGQSPPPRRIDDRGGESPHIKV